MPRTDKPIFPDDRSHPDGRAAGPERSVPTPADIEAARRLGAIETRAAEIKLRFQEHFARNQELWVVREAMALTAERTFPTLRHPRPRGVPQNAFAELMLGQARTNVQARAMGRMAAINTIATRLRNAVTRNAPHTTDVPRSIPTNDALRSPRPRQRP